MLYISFFLFKRTLSPKAYLVKDTYIDTDDGVLLVMKGHSVQPFRQQKCRQCWYDLCPYARKQRSQSHSPGLRPIICCGAVGCVELYSSFLLIKLHYLLAKNRQDIYICECLSQCVVFTLALSLCVYSVWTDIPSLCQFGYAGLPNPFSVCVSNGPGLG